MTSLTPRLDKLDAGLNLIQNGNFDFWQRFTSLVVTFNQDKFVADRFQLDAFGAGGYNVTYARSTDVPTLAESGFQSKYSAQLTNNSTTGQSTFRYIMEGYDYQQLHSKPIRLQFWVKASLTGTYSVAFTNNAANRAYVTTYTVSVANTWEKKTVDVVLDNTGTWEFESGKGLQIWWGLGQGVTTSIETSTFNVWQAADKRTASTNNAWSSTNGATWKIAQIQMVEGDYDTNANIPFTRHANSIARELAACQRYCINPFVSVGLSSTDGSGLGSGQSFSSTLGRVYHAFPTTMRTMPTMTFSAVGDFVTYGTSGTPTATSALSLNEKGVNGVEISFTASSGVLGGAGFAAMLRRSAGTGYMLFEAEL